MTRRALRSVLVAAFALAVLLTGLFAVQSVRHARDFRLPPPEADLPIAGWMTPRYIGHSWDVPREVIAAALGVELGSGTGPQSLDAIARERDIPVEALIGDLEAAIAAHRARAP